MLRLYEQLLRLYPAPYRRQFADDSPATRETNYLVIGTFASRDWANTNYGRKIEHAVELRESGCGISIISEEYWKRFV